MTQMTTFAEACQADRESIAWQGLPKALDGKFPPAGEIYEPVLGIEAGPRGDHAPRTDNAARLAATGGVYRARHVNLDRIFAIKVMHSERVAETRSSDCFLREMKAVGQLDHPHIIRATDAGEDQGFYYLVMEYAEGVDVAEVLRRVGPLPLAEACEIARQTAMELGHAHEHGVIHRDVKPSNLLLTSEGQVKLLDLGLAGLRAGDAITDDVPRGTADYMAP